MMRERGVSEAWELREGGVIEAWEGYQHCVGDVIVAWKGCHSDVELEHQRIKGKKQDLIDFYKDVGCPDKKPTKCEFCKQYRMYPISF